MQLYSDFQGRRIAQIVGDVLAVLIVAGGISVAVTLHAVIAGLGSVGASVASSGTGLASNMNDIGDTLSRVPLIGDSIRGPFQAAGNAGTTLANAGTGLQESIERVATLVGWTVALLVILVVALAWIRPRIRGAIARGVDARLARTPGAWELLAMRALTRRRAADVMAVDDDPLGAWRRGDPAVIRRLAALEVKATGVRLE